jgi:hypothetical protein
MKFEIDFNRHDAVSKEERELILKELGANMNPEGDSYPTIEVEDFEKLKWIEDEVFRLTGEYYALVVGFDSPTIFLDNNV